MIWEYVRGTLVCTCETMSDVVDCQVPCYHECPKCKTVWKLTADRPTIWIKEKP